MIFEENKLHELIKDALKSGDKTRLDTLRGIKTAFMEHKTAKNAKPLDDIVEIGILRALITQRTTAAKEYTEGGREDLAEKELKEAEIIREFLPAEISRETIEAAAREIIDTKDPKMMGSYIKAIREKYPSADGKVVSEVVKAIINE